MSARRKRPFLYQPAHLPPTWSPEWDNTPESYRAQMLLRRELIAAGNPEMSDRAVLIAEVIARMSGEAGLSDSKITRLVTELSAVLDEGWSRAVDHHEAAVPRCAAVAPPAEETQLKLRHRNREEEYAHEDD